MQVVFYSLIAAKRCCQKTHTIISVDWNNKGGGQRQGRKGLGAVRARKSELSNWLESGATMLRADEKDFRRSGMMRQMHKVRMSVFLDK